MVKFLEKNKGGNLSFIPILIFGQLYYNIKKKFN